MISKLEVSDKQTFIGFQLTKKIFFLIGVFNYTFFEHEDHIDNSHKDGTSSSTEHSNEAVIVTDVGPQRQTQA